LNLFRLLLRLSLGRRLPVTRGTRAVRGLHAPVRIHRDRWGIPCIEAESEADACFGIGFCHGQDRTFQLEVLLRVARGTLAELFGAVGLPIDRLSRRIGFRHAAREQWSVLDAAGQAILQAYADGVNAGVNAGLRRRPHEFVLLGARPTPWETTDSLGVLKVLSFTLATNWDSELARLHVLTKDGSEALAALDPAYPHWLPVTAPPGQAAGPALDRLEADVAVFEGVVRGGGSNNWAIAPERTATGRPILANDPHLSALLPAHWYLVQARAPDFAVAGASFVGGPAVLAGHNGHAAWGVTAALVDNTDLFIEQIGPDGASVREGDRFVHCAVREETIRVRGGAAVVERVLVTPRGPILTPAVDAPGPALSLRATWLDPAPVSGLLRLAHVRSFDDLRHRLGPWPATTQNVAYADATGTIGWKIVGTAPRRRKGWGLLPQPGWDPSFGWEAEPVPDADMPYAVNPPEGFLATANNQPLPDGVGPFLGADWIDGYRAAAIARALAARRDWDVASTLALQTDQHTLAWEDLREAIRGAAADDPDARRALELLRGWDGRVGIDSPAAAVYELFLSEMTGRTAQAKAPRSHVYALGGRVHPLTDFNFFSFRRTGHLARLLRTQPAGWFKRSWPEEIGDALAAVVRRLRTGHGEDPAAWAWGRLRTLTLGHLLGRRRRLAGVFNLGPVPCGGDTDTINPATVLPLAPLAGAGTIASIASMRLVIDVGAWHNSRFVLPGGQSGNPFSPHYADLFPLWQRGEGVPIAWTPEEVRAAARETLVLTPAST
jgi:penicillin amidase